MDLSKFTYERVSSMVICKSTLKLLFCLFQFQIPKYIQQILSVFPISPTADSKHFKNIYILTKQTNKQTNKQTIIVVL